MKYLVAGRRFDTFEEIGSFLGVATSTAHRWHTKNVLELMAAKVLDGSYRQSRTKFGRKPVAHGQPILINGTQNFRSINAAARFFKISAGSLQEVLNAGIFELKPEKV